MTTSNHRTRQIDLDALPTRAPDNLDRKEAERKTKQWVKEIGRMQDILHAQQRHSVLIVLQGMDASGKDGAVKNVFADCHPTGVRVVSFKKPTEKEFKHDFLWRIHPHTPALGEMAIFVRSHYEDVLIQRVHNWISEERAQQRIQSINAFERLLAYDNNTLVLKFYLHLSYEQQEEELQERLEEEDKYYKHNPNDWIERKYWETYRRCYEDVINQADIPWHIVPVDQRWYRNYVMSEIVCNAMRELDLAYPPLVEEG